MQQVANKLDAVQTELASLTTRIILAEGELATLKSDPKKDSAVLTLTTHDKLLSFKQKITDLEDRNRRCNIRVYGFTGERGEGRCSAVSGGDDPGVVPCTEAPET